MRSDEQIDIEKLSKYLLNKLEGTDLPLKIRQFGGGAANLTYLLNFSNKFEYVLRRPPLGPVAKSSHDMGREYKVLSVLHKNFTSAPKAFLYCDDLDVIGSNFFIMERKKGFVIRNKLPEFLKNKPGVIKAISENLIDKLVELHSINYESLGLGDLGKPDGFIARQVEGWYGRWEKAKDKDLEEMTKTYNWLRDNIPTSSRSTLIHNDYKLDNVMLNYSDPSEIVAIFDWDMCTLGDPLSDLGAILAYWSQLDDPIYLKAISTMPTDVEGFLTRNEIIRRYEQQSGLNISNINFYHVLGVFRLAVIVAQIYIRFVRKQTQDQRFARLGQVIPFLAKRALELTN